MKLYQFSSPATFYPLAGRLAPWFMAAAAICAAAGLYVGLAMAPTDATQGEAYRIIFIHVPTAWMSMFIYLVMGFWSILALSFNTRLSSMMASVRRSTRSAGGTRFPRSARTPTAKAMSVAVGTPNPKHISKIKTPKKINTNTLFSHLIIITDE